MDQLMMWRNNLPVKNQCLPEGFSIRTYREGDAKDWIRVCKSGELGADNWTEDDFKREMLGAKGILPEGIFFVVNGKNEIAGTATGMILPEGNRGCLHMVCIDPSYRGKGLSGPLNSSVLNYLAEHGCSNVILRTDDFRIPAIKSYLSLGFKPILYTEGMLERWQKILCQTGLREIESVFEDSRSAGFIKACDSND